MLQLDFSSTFVNIIKSFYHQDSFFCEVGQIVTDYLYPRRGLKQGCSLSPCLFNLYVLDLYCRIEDLDVGISLPTPSTTGARASHGHRHPHNASTKVKILLFADDVLLLSSNREDMHVMLQSLQGWCSDYNMNISQTKSKIVSSDSLESWDVITPDMEYWSSLEQVLHSKYLGIDVHPTLKGVSVSKNNKIKVMAKSYATQILRLAKTEADKVDVILSMWNNMALPSLLYGMEVIPISPSTIDELNKWQSTIGKSALQLRSHTANIVTNIELGLQPIEMRIWSMILNYYSLISLSLIHI